MEVPYRRNMKELFYHRELGGKIVEGR
ncbi:MAG: hypothetical protein ACI8RA_002305, partial [Chlamydiales bacterium]